MERIYSAYLDKITRTEEWARERPEEFAEQLNTEYRKIRRSKAKTFKRVERLPVRIYGSGDYIPEHYEFLKELDFKFYIISKSLTQKSFKKERDKLLELDNLTNIVMSFDTQNIKNYDDVKHLQGEDRFRFAFTGTSDDYIIERDFNERRFGIFFNIGQKNEDKQASALIKESCPTDTGKLSLQKACSVCNKCWRSSVTKGSPQQWNQAPGG